MGSIEMMKKGAFTIAPKGASSFEKFLKEVREEVVKQSRRRKPPGAEKMPEEYQGNILENSYNHPDYERKRCKGINRSRRPDRRGGQRCKKLAMKGADYCHYHGGFRQLPKRAAKHIDFIEAIAGDKAAWKEFYEHSGEVRDIVRDAIRGAGFTVRATDAAAGAKAYMADDGGRSWRRWAADLKNRSKEADRKRKEGGRKDVSSKSDPQS